MKYLKKYNLFLEEADLDILATDQPDVKVAKQSMEIVSKQLKEYTDGKKKSDIDTLYKTIKDPTQIEAGLNKILGSDVKSRNPFLVDYVSTSKMKKRIDDEEKENVLDKVKLDDFQQELKIITDPNTKKSLTTKVADVTKRMNDRVKNISKIQNDFLLADKAQKEKILKIEKDIKDNITKISNVNQK